MRDINTAPSHNIFVKTIYIEMFYQIILTDMNLNIKKREIKCKIIRWLASPVFSLKVEHPVVNGLVNAAF
jgi:hypothetical protein